MNPDIELSKGSPEPIPPPSERHPGESAPRSKAKATRPLSVFLVEDEESIRERMIEKFAPTPVKIVDYADSEAVAIVKLRELRCDVIILDLELKQGTGFQVLRELRDNNGSRPWIIVFTNFIDPHLRREAMRLGADFYVDKAKGMDNLAEIIEGLSVPNGDGSN